MKKKREEEEKKSDPHGFLAAIKSRHLDISLVIERGGVEGSGVERAGFK